MGKENKYLENKTPMQTKFALWMKKKGNDKSHPSPLLIGVARCETPALNAKSKGALGNNWHVNLQGVQKGQIGSITLYRILPLTKTNESNDSFVCF